MEARRCPISTSTSWEDASWVGHLDEPVSPGRQAPAAVARPAPAAHAWDVLELASVLERIAEEAVSELGADRLRSLVPKEDVDAARRDLETVEEMRRFLDRDRGWSLGNK